MTDLSMAIITSDGQLLPFSRDLREALAIYARRTWPLNTSGHAAKAWGIDKSTAANLLKGHASDATITRVLRAGGWAVALPVLGAVIGHGVQQYFQQEHQRLVDEALQRQREAERLADTSRQAAAVLVAHLPAALVGAGAAAEGDRDTAIRGRTRSRTVGR